MSHESSTTPTPLGSPPWLWEVLGIEPPDPGAEVSLGPRRYVLDGGLLREREALSAEQAQTSDVFAFKWHQRETFESSVMLARARQWLLELYGAVDADAFWSAHPDRPVLLDAGCGAATSALALFGPVLEQVRYLGIDVSRAVDVAADVFAERGLEGGFMQADLMHLPLAPESVDVVFSQGVLHHTDSTRDALLALARHLKPGGRFLFYVYRRKGPIREFTDDFIRGRIADMSPEEAWEAIVPLTKLGRALGELGTAVDVPEAVDILGIPAGPIDVQRLFYWHVAKAYFDPELTLDEMTHINFDWYAPRNAYRQSREEVRAWCDEAGLEIERECVEEAGIAVVARRA